MSQNKGNICNCTIYLCLTLSCFPPSFSPSGKKFRSKPQLARYLGNKVDLGCFDFRTGKMMPGKLQKNKQRLRHDALSLVKVALMDHTSVWEGFMALLWLCCVLSDYQINTACPATGSQFSRSREKHLFYREEDCEVCNVSLPTARFPACL